MAGGSSSNGDDVFMQNGEGSGSKENGTPAKALRAALKRSALDAELPEESPLHPARRNLISAQLQNGNYERQIASLEEKLASYEAERTDRASEISKLQNDKMILHNAEQSARAEATRLKEELVVVNEAKTRQSMEASTSKSKLSAELVLAKDNYQTLSQEHVKLVGRSESAAKTYTARISALEQEKVELQRYRTEAHKSAEQVDQLMRELLEVREGIVQSQERASGRPARLSLGGAGDGDASNLKSELHRQSQHLNQLRNNNAKLESDIAELRARRDNVEMVRGEMKEVERKWKMKVGQLEDELDQARREMDSFTTQFHSIPNTVDPTTAPGEVFALQHKLSILNAAHAGCKSTESNLRAKISDIQEQFENASYQMEAELVKKRKEADEKGRELRWAQEGRELAETKLGLAKQEVESYKLQRVAGAQLGGDSAVNASYVELLEKQVEEYKTAVENFRAGSDQVHANVIMELDLVKRQDLNEALKRVQQLEENITQLNNKISQLEEANLGLDKEVEDLMLRVGSGEYNTKTWRCITMAGSPAEKDHAIRTEQLERLQKENSVLLERTKELEQMAGSGGGGGGGAGVVPRETFERLQKELEEKTISAEKRLTRLKEAFSIKSREFLEATYSLTGWRFHFDPSGEVILTSMYGPKGKMGLKLKFASDSGHFGTMAMSGGMAKGMKETKSYWVDQRNSIPGFLSQVTLEIFEKTTIGRAPGYKPADEDGED